MKSYKIIILLILFCSISCNRTATNGIIIPNTLQQNANFKTNQKLVQCISQTLQLKPEALLQLIKINCGGAAGCYDLGFVITQIIYKVGEDNFCTIIKDFDNNQRTKLLSFIDVGLEYGDQNNDGKPIIKKPI